MVDVYSTHSIFTDSVLLLLWC